MKLKPLHDNQEINDSVVQHPIITNLVNRDLSSLEKENFIIFPQQLNQSKDLSEDNLIFQSRNGKIWTCNVVGILSDSTDELRIHSRFANQMKHEDFFLRYMLQRVLNYNVINDHFSASKKMTYYDLLVFLFPYYLNEAMRKGIYKEYVKREYNNANIKGAIDVAKHIRSNVPFVGKVAYRTREFSYNNHLTQLIRHTIEKIQNEYDFLLSGDEDTKENVVLIKQTTPDYARLNQFNILQEKISFIQSNIVITRSIRLFNKSVSKFYRKKNQDLEMIKIKYMESLSMCLGYGKNTLGKSLVGNIMAEIKG